MAPYASLRPDAAYTEERADAPPLGQSKLYAVPRGDPPQLWRDVDVEQFPEPQMLIEGLFEAGGRACLYSFPGTGKTFVALDWACCVATATSWCGRRVNAPGRVLYLALEGLHGIGPRLLAWKHAHGYWGREIPIWFTDEPINLTHTETDVEQLVRLVKQHRIRLVVIDTLAVAMPGADEDSSRDMGVVVAALTRLRQAGAAVLVIHHTGKKDGAERGSVALRAGIETVIKLEGRVPNLTLDCEKQRNAEPFAKLSLRLQTVQPPAGKPSLIVEQPTASLAAVDSTLPAWVLPLLRLLAEHRELATGAFAELSGTKPTTFHRRLDAMKALGLVESERAGRTIRNRLTATGVAASARTN